MYRYIRASTKLDMYDPAILSMVPHQDDPTTVWTGGQLLYERDPKFFDTYTGYIGMNGEDKTDRMSWYSAYALCYYSKSQTIKFTTHKKRCPVSEEGLQSIEDELKSLILEYYKSKYDAKMKKDSLRQEGKRRMSASAYTHLVLKQELGISPTFYYSDTRKTLYMLYDLPFTDRAIHHLYESEAEEFKEKFKEILNRLHEKYGFYYSRIRMPLEGTIVRGCWQFITGGSDVIYDKKTNTAEIAES